MTQQGLKERERQQPRCLPLSRTSGGQLDMRRLGAALGWLGLGRDVDGNFTLGVRSGIPAIDRFREAQVESYSHEGIAACFLGNRAENERLLTGEVLEAIAGICAGAGCSIPRTRFPWTSTSWNRSSTR